MELINDNFSRRLHHPEINTRFCRDSAFTIAPDLGRAVEISRAKISVCVPVHEQSPDRI
jgi:hypothetical protein